jgi:hypothetical protein
MARDSLMLKADVTPMRWNFPTPTACAKILKRVDVTVLVWPEAPCL